MSHDDYDFEPIPGLPALPPEGESILWQGSPDWRTLARRVFRLHWIAAYFAALLVYRAAGAGPTPAEVAAALAPALLLSAAACAILLLLSRAIARTTIYTITNRRVVMRFGVALPVTYNLPFASIAAVGLNRRMTGDGDITIKLTGGQRIAYLVLWPHARPGRLAAPEPMLRSLSDVAPVATVLGDALTAYQRSLAAEASHEATDGASNTGPGRIAEPRPVRSVRFPHRRLAAAE